MIFKWLRGAPKGPISFDQRGAASARNVRKYRAGDTIGGEYRVLRVFEGGLGMVYVVEHATGNRLILKTLRGEQSESAQRQFRKEAETWVRLGSHANIVKAFWVNEIAGILCVAAELIEPDEIGRVSLRDYLRFGSLTPTLIARWTAHFCYGLEHATSRGLISHRDIKPENLLIGASGILKITDFGIARSAPRTDESNSPASKLGHWHTNGGAVSGTPPYMAPEQISNAPGQDVRSDIYSFGIVLYEMAYGRMPFAGRTHVEYFDQHLNSKPKITAGPFAETIERCLVKSPDQRYPTPTALLLDLQRVCDARKISLPPQPEPSDTALEDMRARAHALGAIGKRDEAIVCARELVGRAPRDSSNWTQLGRLLLESGDLTGAEDATKRSLALDQTSSAAWNNLGILLKRKGNWHQAVEAFDRALDCDPQNTGAMLNASEPLTEVGKTGEAVIRLRRATEIAPDKFGIWTNLASLYVGLDDRKNALDCFRRARQLAPERYWEEIDKYIHSAQKLPDERSGAALLAAGRVSEARESLQSEIQKYPDNKNAWHNLGLCYLQGKNYSEARKCFGQVYRLDSADGFAVSRLIELAALARDLTDAEKWCDVLKNLPNGAISAIAFRARALEECGRSQEAKRLLQDAILQHPHEPDIFIASGDIAMKHSQHAPAVQFYERAIEELRQRPYHIDRVREIEGKLHLAKKSVQ